MTTAASAIHRAARHRESPFVRRFLAERGLSPSAIPGTGPGGRITRRDVRAYLADAESPPATQGAHPSEREPARPLGVALLAADVDFGGVQRAAHATDNGEVGGAAVGPGDTPQLMAFVARAVVDAASAGHMDDSAGVRRSDGRASVDLAVVDAQQPATCLLLRSAHELRLGAIAHRLSTQPRQPVADEAAAACAVVDATMLPITFGAVADPAPYPLALTVGPVAVRASAVSLGGGPAVAFRPMATLMLAVDPSTIDSGRASGFLAAVKTSLESTDWTRDL